jgi:hypothetical protein
MILTLEDLKYLIANEGIALIKEGVEFKFENPPFKRRLELFFKGPINLRRFKLFYGCYLEFKAENDISTHMMQFPFKYIEKDEELEEFLTYLNFQLSTSPVISFGRLKNLLERMAENENIK